MPEIKDQRELGKVLRYGRFAWPGGYEMFYVTNDGGVLCNPCVNKEIKLVLDSVRNDINDGWKVIGYGSDAELDDYTACEHCNYVIHETEPIDKDSFGDKIRM